MLSKPLHKTTCARVWVENRKTIQPLGFNIHFLHFTTIFVIGQRFLTPKHLIIMNYKVLLLYRKLKYRLRYIFFTKDSENWKTERKGLLERSLMAKSKLKSNAEKVPRKEKDELRICFRVRFFHLWWTDCLHRSTKNKPKAIVK